MEEWWDMAIESGWCHQNDLDGFFGKVWAIVFIKADGSYAGMITAWQDAEGAHALKEGLLFGTDTITLFLFGFDALGNEWQHTHTLPKPTTFSPPPTPNIITLQPTNVPPDITLTDATYDRTNRLVSFTLNGVPSGFYLMQP
jgi:hypothetical protein